MEGNKKDKAISVQGWRGPEGSWRLRAPKFHDNRHRKVVRLSAVRTGRFYRPENIPGTHFGKELSRNKRNYSCKIIWHSEET